MQMFQFFRILSAGNIISSSRKSLVIFSVSRRCKVFLSDEFDIETFREGNRFEAKLAKGEESGFVPEYEQKISPKRTVTVLRLSSDISRTNVQENVHDVQENDRIKALLTLIKQNPDITLKALSEKLNVASKTIQRDLEQLKQEEIVERTGSDRKGQWKIIKG